MINFDLGYYMNIVQAYYNANRETFTEKDFDRLKRNIGALNKEESVELFQKTLIVALESVASLYAAGTYCRDFEDALQETYVILKHQSLPTLVKKSTVLEKYKGSIAECVRKGLSKISQRFQDHNIDLSFEQFGRVEDFSAVEEEVSSDSRVLISSNKYSGIVKAK